MVDEYCETCKYARPIKNNYQCVRYPPQIVSDDERPDWHCSLFPIVAPDAECGEMEKAEAATTATQRRCQ